MKSIVLAATSLLLLPTGKAPQFYPNICQFKNNFDYIEVPPLFYETGEKTIISFVISFTNKESRTMNVAIINPDSTSNIIYKRTFDNYFLEDSFEYDNSYTVVGCKLHFYFDKRHAIKMTPKFDTYSTINPETYDQNLEKNKNIYVYYLDKGWSLIAEKFSFKNFASYYVPDFYHKVDLSTLTIEYKIGECNTRLSTGDAYLSIQDYEGIFSDLGSPMQGGKNRVLPISVVNLKNNIWCLKFKEKVYVHYQTLKMSSSKKEGYVETNYLYLPRNRMKDQENFVISISITEFGVNKSLFSQKMSVKSPLNTFGNCRDSEYCIASLSANPDFELGEKVI